MKSLRLLLTLVISVAVCATIVAAGKSADQTNAVKARHYLYEGMRFEAMNKSDAAYEMYRRAYAIDPDNADAAANYGIARLLIELDTLQSPAELTRSLALMQQRVDRYPGDYEEAESYAYISILLDTIEEGIRVLHRIDSIYPERTSVLLGLARAYSTQGNFAGAIAALDSFESREGTNADLISTRMSLRLAQGDSVNAIADIDRLITEYPKDGEYLILKGNLYDYLSQPDSAMTYYLKAEALDTTAYQPQWALAEAYRDRGDSINYDKMTYKVLLNEQLDMEGKVGILAQYLQTLISDKQDTSRGDYLFDVLTRQYPYEPEVLDLSARYNAAKGNPVKAIENINYALDQDRTNQDYWGQLITYQIQADQYAEAMKTYRRAITNVDDNNGLKVLYATAASLNKDYPTAIEVYSDIIHQIAPTLNINDTIDLTRLMDITYEQAHIISNSFTSIGDALQQAGDKQKSHLAYDNALAIIPDNALALNNYAYFLSLDGEQLEHAAEMSEKAIREEPSNPTYLDTYAWILFMQHKYTEALEYQAAAIEMAEKQDMANAEYYLHYGDILFMNGKPDEALINWQKALDTDKGDLSEKDINTLRKKISHKTFFYN